MRDLIYRLS